MTLASSANTRSQQLPTPAGAGAVAVFICLLLPLAVAACAGANQSAPQPSLSVAAASDLQAAFTEIGHLFEQETGARVTFLYGSSGNLAKQIENGAPIDLFASASDVYTHQLAAKGALVPASEQLFARGRLALVAYKGSGLQIARLEDLRQPAVQHVALANPEHAPYGTAAREALVAAGLWEELRLRAVYGENVRQALQFVQTGNAEAGLVALSLAHVPEVTVVSIPDSLYQPLRQSLAIVQGTPHPQLAHQFATLVTGPRGRAVLERHHFVVPEGGER